MSTSTVVEPDVSTRRGKDGGGLGPWIRCPLCGWRPQAHHRWICKCGHVWNVFDTGGVCPGCLAPPRRTQCGECRDYSPHPDWYELKG